MDDRSMRFEGDLRPAGVMAPRWGRSVSKNVL